MSRKCLLCKQEYKYCKSCKSDAKKEPWNTLYCSENCKNISTALTDYNLEHITKEEAKSLLSNCDLSIELNEHYRNEINEIMAKPKRGLRAKVQIIEEVIPEEVAPEIEEVLEQIIIEEAVEEPNEVVITE